MAHQGHADLLGHFEPDLEWHDPRRAGGVQAHAHLDADDEVAVGVRDFSGADRIHQPQLFALAHHDAIGEAEDAGMRHMQISEDAHLARLDHMLAEAGEIAGAGTAGIDRGGDAGGAAKLLGVDAERGATPIDMGVQVDQAGRHDLACNVAHGGRGIRLQAAADLRHLAVGKRDVADRVEPLRGVDHAAAAQDQVERHFQ